MLYLLAGSCRPRVILFDSSLGSLELLLQVANGLLPLSVRRHALPAELLDLSLDLRDGVLQPFHLRVDPIDVVEQGEVLFLGLEETTYDLVNVAQPGYLFQPLQLGGIALNLLLRQSCRAVLRPSAPLAALGLAFLLRGGRQRGYALAKA